MVGARIGRALLCSAVAVAIAVPGAAGAQVWGGEVQAAIQRDGSGGDEVRAFYRSRGYAPLWTSATGIRPEAGRLLDILDRADLDGLDRKRYKVNSLASALRKAERGSPKAIARAEMLLSRSFANYVRDVRRVQAPRMHFVDGDLAPRMPSTQAVLAAAASAPSLMEHLDNAGWMHPIYGQLRRSLEQADPGSEQARILRLNLQRARLLPAETIGRHVVVDAAGARLLMYEGGRLHDSMKVIVGRQTDPTPEMAAYIRYASVNPYWNIPPDLTRDKIAPLVVKEGLGHLRKNGYEVLSDWSTKATVANPKLVNWQAVAAGRQQIRLRQKPGPINGMGKVKFMFPNELGIYLHDTPDRGLFREADRSLSAGCVRVEDSARLARWLFGKPLPTKVKKPEHRVDLPTPVPVFITYLTAFPEQNRIAFHADRYGRDRAALNQRKPRGFAGL